jgi:hypothetical protein
VPAMKFIGPLSVPRDAPPVKCWTEYLRIIPVSSRERLTPTQNYPNDKGRERERERERRFSPPLPLTRGAAFTSLGW